MRGRRNERVYSGGLRVKLKGKWGRSFEGMRSRLRKVMSCCCGEGNRESYIGLMSQVREDERVKRDVLDGGYA